MDTVTPPMIISAVPTPFDDRGRVDDDAFRDLLSGLPAHHRTVLVAGTTGEFPALTDDERIALFRSAVHVLGADRVIAHVGSAALAQSIRLAEAAAEAGIDQVALLTPYYLPVDDDQVVEHFARFGAARPSLRVFAYLFPERTGVDLTPETVADILALPSVVGLKLSGRANDHLRDHRAHLRDGQRIYSGDDRRALTIRSEGGDGVISGCFPVFPDVFVDGLAAGGVADPDRQQRIDTVVDAVGPSIARQKYALRTRTGRPWHSRMSMPRLDDATRRTIDRLGEQV